MDFPHCWLCDVPIGESLRDKEHIIPEALGGKRTVTDFICKKCNNDTGSKWDARLWESVRPLVSIASVGIPGKGHPSQWQMADGRTINKYPDTRWEMAPDRPLRLASRLNDRQVEVIGQPGRSTIKRDVTNFKKHLQQFADLDLGFNIEKALDSLEIKFTETHMEFEVYREFHFGDPQSVKSMLKSILALAFEAGVDRKHCNSILTYLKGETPAFPYVLYGFYGGKDVIQNREDVPYLCVHVKGLPICGELLAYAEVCGYRIASVLSRNYSGDEFDSTYAVDIVDKEEQQLECQINEYMVSVAEWLMPTYGINDPIEFNRILEKQFGEESNKWVNRSQIRARNSVGELLEGQRNLGLLYQYACHIASEYDAVISCLSETGVIGPKDLIKLRLSLQALLVQVRNVLGFHG